MSEVTSLSKSATQPVYQGARHGPLGPPPLLFTITLLINAPQQLKQAGVSLVEHLTKNSQSGHQIITVNMHFRILSSKFFVQLHKFTAPTAQSRKLLVQTGLKQVLYLIAS